MTHTFHRIAIVLVAFCSSFLAWSACAPPLEEERDRRWDAVPACMPQYVRYRTSAPPDGGASPRATECRCPVTECPIEVVCQPSNELSTYCKGPPYSQLSGYSFSTWSSPDCAGNTYARGALSEGQYECAQWSVPGMVEGEVYCVDLSSPVATIYFRDPNQGWECVPWTLTTEPWYAWRPCGMAPLSGESI